MSFTALMALFDSEIRDELFLLMEMAKIQNYTHFTKLHGSSESGKKEGSVAWPGSNEILMIIVNEEEREKFKDIVANFRKERDQKPPLLVFHWPLTELF